jgi:acylphosphatase
VRNRSDGSVEAVFAGDEHTVAEMIKLCRRGPDGSRVVTVEEQATGPDELNLRKNGERFSELNTV